MLKRLLDLVQSGGRPVRGPSGQDLTPLWDQAHAHLRPMPGHLPLTLEDRCACPLCGHENAVLVRANLRFGSADWRSDSSVRYCPECERFSLAADDESEPRDAGSEVTAVDGRLWSASPTVLNIEPTTRCNFDCWYCVGREMVQADLTLEDFEQVLEHFPSLQVVAIVGEGEPIMNKRFFDMVAKAKARGLRVLSLSNGSTFSESVVRKICASGLDYIGISIDSVNPETFAESRLGGDLNKVWRGIERLARYRDAHGYHYPVLGLKGTLFRHTENELVEIVTAAKAHGIDVLESFQPLNRMTSYQRIYPEDKQGWIQDYERVQGAIRSDAEAANAILPGAGEWALREGLPLSNSGRLNGLRPNCDEEWLYSLLSGDITPCCQIKDVQDPGWNLVRRPVTDILSDQHYERTRFNLWNGFFPRYCEGCHKTRA